jgi:hypothetical protein
MCVAKLNGLCGVTIADCYRSWLGAGAALVLGLSTITISAIAQETPGFQALSLKGEPRQITPAYLRQRVLEWLVTAEDLPGSEAQLEAFIRDMYLQRGNPNAKVYVKQAFTTHPEVTVDEQSDQAVTLESLKITGGTPLLRWLVGQNIHGTVVGQSYDHAGFLENLDWISHNLFLPIDLHFSSTGSGKVGAEIEILTYSAIFPTGNISSNGITGLALTAGVISDNYLLEGSVFRALVKRNNIPILNQPAYLVQDWEYVVGASTTQLPIAGMTLGFNQYNKVDYIYRGLKASEPNQVTWIQSLGGDLYSGFPIWSDPQSHRYLRGVANLSIIRDSFFNGPDNSAPDPPLSQSGGQNDLLFLPSMNLIFSDVDDYIIPRNGNFLRFQASGSLGGAQYAQATAAGFSFWTPFQGPNWQGTFLFRNALGTTLGQNFPFYRGFLNTGNWLVRGAREFSITEKHSVRSSPEFHIIFKPSNLNLEAFFQAMVNTPGLGAFLNGWAFDLNAFVDAGAYWNDNPVPRSFQMGAGVGLNTITPTGSILGVDMAFPVYPTPAGPTFLLRISSPLTFTLYSDWINSNGFFLR